MIRMNRWKRDVEVELIMRGYIDVLMTKNMNWKMLKRKMPHMRID